MPENKVIPQESGINIFTRFHCGIKYKYMKTNK